MRYFIVCLLLIITVTASAQITVKASRDTSWKNIYRASAPKINDLVHTKLNVTFDYAKAYMYGKAWITLHPHFYPTDSLNLDAKGMNINQVALVKNGKNLPLKYTYDSLNLRINLNKNYKAGENYTVYIDYVSKPNELQALGSVAITGAKGLYFINPQGKDSSKPIEIWTQGETEATSVWCPTIDRTNQKTTEEISMTVPAKYVTLSNGLLISQKKNTDGTRTDTWKMDQPHSPYLFFMGVGDFAVIKDAYKGKEVSYYVEKEYAPVARKIFGLTPEMIKFFSEKLNFQYPWPKYAQMTGRDYVSGAMENTSATLHTDALQQNARQLVDGNKYEDYISHELFHQWFGDLVTAESWSNLTLNESFANYSEYLWREYKYGKDNADELNYNDLNAYLTSGDERKNLVRFYYRDKEDMFDRVSYEKGGRILHMLRNYIGDSAFFKGLNLYLNTYKFSNAEVQQLRLAFEQVSGLDLNTFFNQWYFNNGNPELDISYNYDAATQTEKVFLKQTQQENKIFRLPFAIDVYHGNSKQRYNVWMNNRQDTFSFHVSSKPGLVNVDAEKILLADKQDHKTTSEFVHQYKYAGNYVDRREAVDYCIAHTEEPEAKNLVAAALNDKYHGIRNFTMKNLTANVLNDAMIAQLQTTAKSDSYKPNRALAISLLGDLKQQAYKAFFVQNITDSSYSIAGAALTALSKIDQPKAITLLPQLKKDAKDKLLAAIEQVEVLTKTDDDFTEMYSRFINAKRSAKLDETSNFIVYLQNVQNVENFKKGIDAITAYRDRAAEFSSAYKIIINNELQQLKQNKETSKATIKNKTAIEDEISYLDKKLNDAAAM